MMSVNKSLDAISYHLFLHNETDTTTIIFTRTDLLRERHGGADMGNGVRPGENKGMERE